MNCSSLNQNPCVLVVDDHWISRQHCVEALRQISSRVKQASNSQEAIEIALSQLPDLIVMDISLPDDCGLACLNQIRTAWPQYRNWPKIIILSGDTSSLHNEIAIRLGIGAVLMKPASLDKLRETVIRLLQFDQGVRDYAMTGRTAVNENELRICFLEELKTRIPILDREITCLNWRSARLIVHQLIASTAMCSEHTLELHCRRLYQVLKQNPAARPVAQSYYSFLREVEVFNAQQQSQ